METRSYTITHSEVREAADDKPARFEGWASVFDSASHDLGGFREFVKPGAFSRSIAEANRGERNVFLLWNHENGQPLGSTRGGKLTISEDERGLKFSLDPARMTPAQLDAARDGDLSMSFGFNVRSQEWRELEDGSVERDLIDVDLHEISAVIAPAYPATEAALRSLTEWRSLKAREIETPAEILDAVTAEIVDHTVSEAFEEVRAEVLSRHHANILKSSEYRHLLQVASTQVPAK